MSEGNDTRPPAGGPLRRLYEWTLSWANTPYGMIALFVLAFCESSFFPIPPDVLLIPLCLGMASRAFRFALVCSAGSVLGGAFGYLLGLWLMEPVCLPIVDALSLQGAFAQASALYHQHDALAVGIAGFSPIPYKVFTILAGVVELDFGTFLLASAVSRSARFFLVAWLLHAFGAPIRVFIERYLNTLALVFVVLLVGSFVLLGKVRGQVCFDPAEARRLLAQMESGDLGTRRRAARQLRRLTGSWHGFVAGDPADKRERAVQRWAGWLDEARR